MLQFKRTLSIACCLIFSICLSAQVSDSGKYASELVESQKIKGESFTPVDLFVAGDIQDVKSQRPDISSSVREGTILKPDGTMLQTMGLDGPQTMTFALPKANGAVIELELVKVNLFTPDFSVVESSTGEAVRVDLGSHYRGVIKGQPNSLAAISIFGSEVMGLIASQQEGNLVLGKLKTKNRENEHILYNDRDLMANSSFSCDTPDDHFQGYTDEDLLPVGPEKALSDCIRLYIEVASDIYSDKGGTTGATNYVTGLFNQSFVLYAAESLNMVISQIFVWNTTDPYTSTTSSGQLSQFQSATSSINGDLGHLVSYQASGGIAAGFSGICATNVDNSLCFSSIEGSYNSVPTYSWSVMVVTHEMGHLIGSRHTHACVWNGNNTAIDGCSGSVEGSCPLPGYPSGGGTIMSYCHLQSVGINFNNGFGLQPGNVIRNTVTNATCLTSCGPAHCTNNVLDGDETDIDCGGSCPACPTCTDGIQNGDETGVDCGGSCPNTCPISYCSANGTNTNYEWINNVSVGSINNTSGNNGGYGNFTGISTDLDQGAGYSISLSPGFASTVYSENWGVWIDFNVDGDFTDAGEQIFSGTGNSTVAGSISIPGTAPLGSTRMRVVMIWNATPQSCGSFTYGEVEDYTVNIVSVGCPPQGTPCDDNDPNTYNDVEDGNCGCAGTPCPVSFGLSFTENDVSCGGTDDASISVSATGGASPIGYSWTGPGGYTGSGSSISGLSPGNYSVIATDANGCTDNGSASVSDPNSTFYADSDGDGYGDPGSTTRDCSAPSGYVSDNTDCNDGNSAINPGASEICDGIDNNCDGNIDEGLSVNTYYADNDGDGYGNPGNSILACVQPSGYVPDNTDCNDGNSAINPGASEICDGIDNNCDGNIDEGLPSNTYYADNDEDGYGNSGITIQACSQPSGYVSDNTDCNDGNSAINPGASEICDGIDNNCDGNIDEGLTLNTYYADADGDGYGNPAVSVQNCAQPSGYVSDNTDCNDGNSAINPGASEICDGIDNNCDGNIDEGLTLNTYYADADGDGYGNPAVSVQNCAQPSGYVSDNTDCNDGNSAINPGAVEVCDGVDNNCDGNIDEIGCGGCTYTVINFNNFESGWGIWNDGGSDCRRHSSDASYALGTYCVRLRDNTSSSVMTTDNVNLSSYTSVKINFSYYPRSMDNSNEDFWLQISTNGGSSYATVEEWNFNDEFVNNQRYYDEVTLSGPFPSNTRFRFRCDGSNNGDYVYIDEVEISACNEGGALIEASRPDPGSGNEEERPENQDTFSSLSAPVSGMDLNIFPNPALDKLTIELDAEGTEFQGQIFDLRGRQIWAGPLYTGQNDLSIAQIPSGMYYFLVIESNGLGVVRKFVKAE